MADRSRLEALRRQFEDNPRRYFAPLASALTRAGDAGAAVALARAQLVVYPEHLTGHVILGQALLATGDEAGARAAFSRAAELDSGNVVALQRLVTLARSADDEADARAWTERLREADPELAAQLDADDEERRTRERDADDAAGVARETPAGGAVIGEDADDVPDAFAALELEEFSPADLDPALAVDVSGADAREEQAELAADGWMPPPGESPEPDVAVAAAVDAQVEEEDDEILRSLDEPDARAEEPAVGLDVAPAEALPEALRDAPVDIASGTSDGPPPFATRPPTFDAMDDEAPTDDAEIHTAGPYVTETMAELLVAQGHPRAALDVYEQLLVARPDAEALRERVRGLREQLAVDAASPDGTPTVPDDERAAPADRPVEAGTFFRSLARGPELVPHEASDAPGDETATTATLEAPGDARVSDVDERAARVWRAAFAVRRGAAAARPPAADAGAGPHVPPTAPVDPFAGVTYDQFFGAPDATEAQPAGAFDAWAAAADAAPGGAAPTPKAAAAPAAAPPNAEHARRQPPDDPDADLADFNAWLRGLAQ